MGRSNQYHRLNGFEDIAKIDDERVRGLRGPVGSIGHLIHELVAFNNSYQHWYGAAAVPNGDIHVADADSMTPFQMDAGNDTWGSWLQVLGSSDTPHHGSESLFFRVPSILFTDVEHDVTLTRIQIVSDSDPDIAYANHHYSETCIIFQKNVGQGPWMIVMKRVRIGAKVWIRNWVSGENTGTMDFMICVQEYPT